MSLEDFTDLKRATGPEPCDQLRCFGLSDLRDLDPRAIGSGPDHTTVARHPVPGMTGQAQREAGELAGSEQCKNERDGEHADDERHLRGTDASGDVARARRTTRTYRVRFHAGQILFLQCLRATKGDPIGDAGCAAVWGAFKLEPPQAS